MSDQGFDNLMLYLNYTWNTIYASTIGFSELMTN